MANVTKAAESLIYLLKETNYAGVDELKASTLEWAFVGAEESESAGAILNWLTYSLDAEENALTDEEIDW
ncbi:hypothetical protein BDF19DRAFT_435785 [Syncephalis fuscata]|nr:hypothetical protein BDF19DRAFT_435785 [Syncephalis fuscata]